MRLKEESVRDHSKLRAFELADDLAILVYQATTRFPSHEQFGLTNQLRRAAVSIPSNIVEGCARATEAEYLRFLDIAYGSTKEVEYQLSLATRLGYLSQEDFIGPQSKATETAKVLAGLIRALRSRKQPKA